MNHPCPSGELLRIYDCNNSSLDYTVDSYVFVKSVHVALHHLDFASALRTESVAGFELSKTAG
jgi:hypothetical protein